jgi:hypothetical protein
MVKLLRRIINLFKKCKMAKINNTAAYQISTPVVGSDIVIGSALGNNGDTKNFQMSAISTFVLGNAVTPTLDDVCQQGASTTTGITVAGTATFNGAIDANSTADVSGAVTLGSTLGVTGAVTLSAGATINGSGLAVNGSGGILVTDVAGITSSGGPVSGTALNTSGGLLVSGISLLGEIDSAGPADIADTLTLSKPSGTGLNVTSNATIGGTLTLGSTSISTSGINTGTILSTGTVAASFLATDPSGAPASSSAAGILGSIVADANYIYVCTATDTWKRAALATW